MSDYKNPPNPHHKALVEAWLEYSEAYHSNEPMHSQDELWGTYETARKNYDNNPQTIFNNDIRR